MFADYLMLFCKATQHEVEELKDYLDTYARWIGPRMNNDKSVIFGSKNIFKKRTQDLGEILGAVVHYRLFGAQIGAARSRYQVFHIRC